MRAFKNFNLRASEQFGSAGIDLLGSYFTTALRSLRRNKVYAFINILGLALGIASSILILLWVNYENSYDHFATNHENIFQVKVNRSINGTINTEEEMCVPAYQALRVANSRITNSCFTTNTYGHDIAYQNKLFGPEVLEVSKEFLDMFGIPIVKGNIHSLDEPKSIMLNESMAKEIFGGQDPINQTVLYNRETELRVTGIFKDVPRNSTFWFMALVPIQYNGTKNEWLTNAMTKWDQFYPRVYVTVQPGSSLKEINGSIRNMLKPHTADTSNPEMFLQAMDRWHLFDHFVDGEESGGKIEYVRLFSWIAALTLMIACINYMNLSTAQSQKRAREVGIRKAIGSGRPELVRQFLLESFCLTSISFVIAFLIVELVLPSYNDLIGSRLDLDLKSTEVWIGGAFLVIATSFIAGGYPAFYLSSFQPVKVLKGKLRVEKRAGSARNALVVMQYAFSIFLLMGVLVIYLQIGHVRKRNLGYQQHGLVAIAFNPAIRKNYDVLKNELLNSGAVEAVTRSNEGIDVDYFTSWVEWDGKSSDEIVQFSRISTEYDYIKTNRIRIIEGRDFSRDFPSDSTAALVNETAVKLMRLKDPIGKVIKSDGRKLTIIGIMEDVVRGSPFESVAPLYAGILRESDNHLTFRLTNPDSITKSMKIIAPIFKKFDPENAFGYQMVSDRFLGSNFRSIELTDKLVKLFTGLAIFLTAMGILGLASYTAEQRTKELAIRKTLGATVEQLVLLLSGYFIRVAVVALVIAIPLSWWGLNRYLQNFSYRITIPCWIAPMAGIIIIVVTLAVVGTQVLRAALANPVRALGSDR